MTRSLIVLCCISSITSCVGDNVRPAFLFRSVFDPDTVNDVEIFMRALSEQWEFRLYEKDREEIESVTRGEQEAFFLFLYYEDDSILAMGNVGAGNVITLDLYDFGKMPLGKL